VVGLGQRRVQLRRRVAGAHQRAQGDGRGRMPLVYRVLGRAADRRRPQPGGAQCAGARSTTAQRLGGAGAHRHGALCVRARGEPTLHGGGGV
jgi:hypothetical protein